MYDIEPNRYKGKDLPRRRRYYQALTDAKLLDPGREYKHLPEYVSIWILTEDPFGTNRMVYTVRNKVEKLEEIHKIVTSIKENAERRNRYMTLKEMIQFEKEESYDEGYDEGVAFG